MVRVESFLVTCFPELGVCQDIEAGHFQAPSLVIVEHCCNNKQMRQ